MTLGAWRLEPRVRLREGGGGGDYLSALGSRTLRHRLCTGSLAFVPCGPFQGPHVSRVSSAVYGAGLQRSSTTLSRVSSYQRDH